MSSVNVQIHSWQQAEEYFSPSYHCISSHHPTDSNKNSWLSSHHPTCAETKISSHLTDRKNMAFQPPLTRQKLCPGTVNNACGSGGGLCTPFKVDFQVASFRKCVNGCLVASMSKRLSALQNGQGKLLIALGQPNSALNHSKSPATTNQTLHLPSFCSQQLPPPKEELVTAVLVGRSGAAGIALWCVLILHTS